MKSPSQQFTDLLTHRANAELKVQTLGAFQVVRGEEPIKPKEWGRDKTLQLFQFFVTARHRRGLHKEQIVDRIWEDIAGKSIDQTFKVALHGVNKALEPNRKGRSEAKFVLRQGLTYQLDTSEVWVDVQAVEDFIEIGNLSIADDKILAQKSYREAVNLYAGIYLPERLYEDWSSEQREHIQVLILGAIVALGELLIEENPMESIRLSQKALIIDKAWEDAYRVQMAAYLSKGNRPMAIKTYKKCVAVLEEEFGIEPLPETQELFAEIKLK